MAVYLVSDGDYVKIGSSVDPKRRIMTLQTASSRPLQLLAVLPGDEHLERTLHDRFRASRIRGEWFQLGEEDVKDAVQFAKEYAERVSRDLPGSSFEPMVDPNAPAFADNCRYQPTDTSFDGVLSRACDQGALRRCLLLGVLQWVDSKERRASYVRDARRQLEQEFSGDARHLVVDPSVVMEEMGKVWYSGAVCAETVRRSVKRLLASRVLQEGL